jgi:hypothetical protein
VDSAREAELVRPFYLKMMGTAAVENGEGLLRSIVDVGKTTTTSEILALLSSNNWRPIVMGAWFALLHNEDAVTDAVLAATRYSVGGTACGPPLATAAVVLADRAAVQALSERSAHDVANAPGGCGPIAAALEHLGVQTDACEVTASDRARFAAMLAIAQQLQAAP